VTLTATFHSRFREALQRRKAEVPMKVICYESGLGVDYIRRLSRGEQSNPTLVAVEGLAAATGVSVAWLLGLEYGSDTIQDHP
jgi:transcriptional regulator with XRE-family HTH domain